MFSNKVKAAILAVAVIASLLCVYMFFGAGLSGSSSKSSTSSVAATCSVSRANLSWNTQYAPSDKYCIVLHTFVRTDLVIALLKHYSKFQRATRIIVVWSDKRLTPPTKEWEKLGPHPIPVHFRVQERNSIMNKLQPFPEIDTPGNNDTRNFLCVYGLIFQSPVHGCVLDLSLCKKNIEVGDFMLHVVATTMGGIIINWGGV